MKSLHIVKNTRNAIIVDHSMNTVDTLNYISTDIDEIYVAPEDMTVHFTRNGEKKSVEAKKGDIVIKFYEYDYTVNPVIVVKNGKWKENILEKEAANKKKQIDKETWALKSADACCGCECECCCKDC